MHEYVCFTCGKVCSQYLDYTEHITTAGHAGQLAKRIEDAAGRTVEERKTEIAYIQNAALTATCYCHRTALNFHSPRIKVSLWTPDNVEEDDYRVEIQMRGVDFHHAEPYPMKVRGELADAVFAFPFLEIQAIESESNVENWWWGVFRSKADKTGAHFAIKNKEGIG